MAILSGEPRGIGQVLDTGFRLYFKSIRKVFLLAVLAILVGEAPMFWMLAWVRGVNPRSRPELLAQLPAGFFVLLVVAGLSGLLLYGAVLVRMHNIGRDAPARLGDALGRSFRALAWLVIATILTGLVVDVGLVLLLVPGIIFLVSLQFANYAILLERKGPLGGMNYSHKVVWGNWWRTAGVLAVIAIILLAVWYGLGLLLSLGLTAAAPGGLKWLSTAVWVVLYSLILPLGTALKLALYEDLKLRKEGIDLEARIGDAATA
ncbi:MAG TPA: YciC family protein [Gammaproteobacteria bacterium]|nr:YciC family protein [Gammaproteobacteria bacterium]